MAVFENRLQAGRTLAEHLAHVASEHPIVLGLPRGGVSVAFEVAQVLRAPLDVIIVRKLGVPGHRELGFGALGEDDVRVLDLPVIEHAGLTDTEIAMVEAEECRELADRVERYRVEAPAVSITGRTVIVVDDGIATGGTARAAVDVARARGASRVVLAAPVASAETARSLAELVDELVVVETPTDLGAIGFWYRDFSQTPDAEVLSVLRQARERDLAPVSPAGPRDSCVDQDVSITMAGHALGGHVNVPDGAGAIVVFAHGDGGSRTSPPSREVAGILNRAGLGTFLVDLLDATEADESSAVFDVPLLARRLSAAVDWLRNWPACSSRPFGLLGAGTAAAAALTAAAQRTDIFAVVLRSGRVDLVDSETVRRVKAPTLLIVGENDHPVRDANEHVATDLRTEHRLEVIRGAGHLFEEPGALSAATHLAGRWFADHLEPGLVAAVPHHQPEGSPDG